MHNIWGIDMTKTTTDISTRVYANGSPEFKKTASSLAASIKLVPELSDAFTAYCQSRNLDEAKFIQNFAEDCLYRSAENISTETGNDGNEIAYGDFNGICGLMVAHVELLGLSTIRDALTRALPPSPSVKIRTRFGVSLGKIDCMVELVGKQSDMKANCRIVRDVLRSFGFGDIDTCVENMATEKDDAVSIPTFAQRTFPHTWKPDIR